MITKEKEKTTEEKVRKKKKFKITMGMKATFSIALMLIFMGMFLITAMRYMFTILSLNDQINDMYHIVNTGLSLVDIDNMNKACEAVREVYDSIPEELKNDPESELYLRSFRSLTAASTGVDLEEIDRLLNVIKNSNWEIGDIGIGLLDDNNKRIIIVRSLDDTPTGYWDDFQYATSVTVADKNTARFVTEYDKDETKDFYTTIKYRSVVPIDKKDESNLAGYVYFESHGEELHIWSIIFLVVFSVIFVIIMIIVLPVFAFLFRKMMIKPIKKLARAAEKWAESTEKMGEQYYFKNLDIKTHDEVRDLKEAMVSMEDELHDYMTNLEVTTKEKLKLSSEIEVTARLQANLLPDKLIVPEQGIEIFSFMRPARQVGGDFYDYFKIDEKRYGIVIADVSDKGVPASMFMVISRTLLYNDLSENPDDIAFAIGKSNEKLCDRNGDMMFVTAFAGILDVEKRTLSYVNAGHEDPIVYRKVNDKYEIVMEEHDVFLGVYDEASFTKREMQLDPGDRLFLYTDGVTEAMDINDKLFGIDRLIEVLNRDSSVTGDHVIASLWDEISGFQEGKSQADDVTMLLLQT